MRDASFTFLFSVLMLASLGRPWLGLLAWVWIDYMNPHRLCYFYAKYDIPFSFIAAAVTIGAMVVSPEKKRFPWTRETIVWLLFIIWMNLTTFFALNPVGAWIEWDRTMKIQMLIAATLIIVQNRFRLEGLIWVIAGSLAFYGVKGGLYTILHGGMYRVYGPEYTFIEDNNDLALALVTTIPLMRYLMLVSERRLVRWGLGSGIALIAISVFGSYSRGGLLGLAVVLGLMLLKSRRRVVFALGLLVVLPVAIQMMPQQWFDRMNTIRSYEGDNSVQGRLNAWHFALNVAEARPLTGGGFRVFTKSLFQQYAPDPDDYHEAHNIFLKIMAEHGYVGLALFLLMVFCSWRSATWIRRHTKYMPELQWTNDLAAMVQVALAGYAVGGSFLNLAYFDLPYHLMTIIVITKLMVRERLAAQAEAASESDGVTVNLAPGEPAVSCP